MAKKFWHIYLNTLMPILVLAMFISMAIYGFLLNTALLQMTYMHKKHIDLTLLNTSAILNLKAVVERQGSYLKHLEATGKSDIPISALKVNISKLTEELNTLSTTVSNNPEKAISMTLLQKESQNTEKQISQIQWIISGLLVPLVITLIGLVATNKRTP